MTTPEVEHVEIPMVCVCPTKIDKDKPYVAGDDSNYDWSRRQAADLKKLDVMAAMGTEKHPVTHKNFLSAAYAHLYFNYRADVTFAVDQWFGAYATVTQYVQCEHTELASEIVEQKKAAGMDVQQAIKEAYAENACPDEPKCFVYRWDEVLKVSVQCDRLEDGLVALLIWFRENRKKDDE